MLKRMFERKWKAEKPAQIDGSCWDARCVFARADRPGFFSSWSGCSCSGADAGSLWFCSTLPAPIVVEAPVPTDLAKRVP